MSDDAPSGPDAPALPRDPNPSRLGPDARPPLFVPVASATAEVAPEAMDRLRRAGITAHLDSAAPGAGGMVYVDADDAHDARTVLGTLDAGIGPAQELDAQFDLSGPPSPPSDAQSVEDTFAALVSYLDETTWSTESPGPTTPAPADPQVADDAPDLDSEAIGDAVSQRLYDEKFADPPELREEHYEPPPPPPVPRPGPMALLGIAIILCGIAVLAFGTSLGIAPDHTLPMGIIAVLTGAGLLGARLKRYRDDDDDGAVL